ncbi:MauE/DoxX family redox-associated membrane protein [Aquincola agrisoli]
MVMPEHVCPFGLKSVDLLKRRGFAIDDRWIRTRDEQEALKARWQVESTPQTFIGGRRIGGWDELRRHFGQHVRAADDTSYVPVVVVFGVAATLTLAFAWAMQRTDDTPALLRWFIATTMCLLAMLKLQDIERFSTMFLNYDLLARRVVRYAYVYPWAEFGAGALMLAGVATSLAAPLALFVGTVGAVSVFKAVYVDRRELKCACVGGAGSVPLGFVSLTENLLMIGMGAWMLAV